jgi:ABC-type branched-subunit amino acid transport system substrate-binding protein
LQAYLRLEWNANVETLGMVQRVKGFREAALDVWELKGPGNTWEGQLEEFYKKQPVFAILGGIASGSWGPIHRFSEKHKVPCIFPVTDLPEIAAGDWYTLYFWKGYYQEGETAAKYLARVFALPPDKKIVQVLRDDDRGRALAKGFSDTWKKFGGVAPLEHKILAPGESAGRDFWKGFAAEHGNAVALLWLGPEDLAGLGAVRELPQKPSLFFASGTMLGKRVQLLPDAIRDNTFVTYPYRMPGDEKYITSIVEQWLKFKKIEPKNTAVSSKVFFLTRVLSDSMTSMRGELYRDFFLDLMDTMVDQTMSSLDFPRLSFGPGQRYASKGCYIVTVTKGPQPVVVRESEWIVY